MNKYLYAILRLKTTSWIKYWLYNKTMKIKGVLSNILEGISFYLTDSLNRKFNLFQIIGRSVQDGTPTPENPVEIKNTGDSGSVNEKVQNKNFLNVSSVFEVTGYTSIPISLEANENYVLSANKINTNGSSNNMLVGLKNEDNTINYIYSFKTNNLTVNFTPKKNVVAILIYSQNGYNQSVGVTSVFYNLMISKEGGEYQAHEEQNISFPLAQGQKFMEGDYLADDGVHHVIREQVFNGTEGFGLQYGNEYYISVNPICNRNATTINVICNYYKGVSREDLEGMGNGHIAGSSTYIRLKDDRFSTLSEFKSWVAEQYANGAPIKIQYKLENEVIDPYTPEQQIAWEQIKALRTYKPVTHINSEDETPANLKIQYWKEG